MLGMSCIASPFILSFAPLSKRLRYRAPRHGIFLARPLRHAQPLLPWFGLVYPSKRIW